MELNELIKQVLMQMYQNCLDDKTELEHLDKRVISAIRKERESDGNTRVCRSSESSAVGG